MTFDGELWWKEVVIYTPWPDKSTHTKAQRCFSPPRPALGECRRKVIFSLTFPYTSLVWGCPKMQRRRGLIAGTFSITSIMCLSSDRLHPAALPFLSCCSCPTLVAHSSETSVTPTAHPDPLVCNLLPVMFPTLIANWPAHQPKLKQHVFRASSLSQLLLLFHKSFWGFGSVLVFSDLKLNFLMTAVTSPCLVVNDMKCLGGLAAKRVVSTLWQLAARCAGFLVVLHCTGVKLCDKSDVTNPARSGASTVTTFGSLFLYKVHLWKHGSPLLPDKCK